MPTGDAIARSEELEPIALIPIGYPSEEVIAEKKRKPLDDILF